MYTFRRVFPKTKLVENRQSIPLKSAVKQACLWDGKVTLHDPVLYFDGMKGLHIWLMAVIWSLQQHWAKLNGTSLLKWFITQSHTGQPRSALHTHILSSHMLSRMVTYVLGCCLTQSSMASHFVISHVPYCTCSLCSIRYMLEFVLWHGWFPNYTF